MVFVVVLVVWWFWWCGGCGGVVVVVVVVVLALHSLSQRRVVASNPTLQNSSPTFLTFDLSLTFFHVTATRLVNVVYV